MGCTLLPPGEYDNSPCAAAMRPYLKLLWPLVLFCYCYTTTTSTTDQITTNQKPFQNNVRMKITWFLLTLPSQLTAISLLVSLAFSDISPLPNTTYRLQNKTVKHKANGKRQKYAMHLKLGHYFCHILHQTVLRIILHVLTKWHKTATKLTHYFCCIRPSHALWLSFLRTSIAIPFCLHFTQILLKTTQIHRYRLYVNNT